MWIGQTASVSSFKCFHLGEGFFAEVGCSKECCQRKTYRSYWGSKQIPINSKKRLRSAAWPPLLYHTPQGGLPFQQVNKDIQIPSKHNKIYYTLPLLDYMFRLLGVLIRSSSELIQNCLIPSALWDPVALTIVGAIVLWVHVCYYSVYGYLCYYITM